MELTGHLLIRHVDTVCSLQNSVPNYASCLCQHASRYCSEVILLREPQAFQMGVQYHTGLMRLVFADHCQPQQNLSLQNIWRVVGYITGQPALRSYDQQTQPVHRAVVLCVRIDWRRPQSKQPALQFQDPNHFSWVPGGRGSSQGKKNGRWIPFSIISSSVSLSSQPAEIITHITVLTWRFGNRAQKTGFLNGDCLHWRRKGYSRGAKVKPSQDVCWVRAQEMLGGEGGKCAMTFKMMFWAQGSSCMSWPNVDTV